MTDSLRLLLVEDSEADAKLIVHELRSGGRLVEFERVEEEAPLRAALAHGPWDIVIADWSLPKFSALAALEVVKELSEQTPFLVVSGTVGEDVAVEALRAGARDFVLKDKTTRLLPAVERELREAKVREDSRMALRRSEQRLLDAGARFRALIERNADLIALIASDGTTLYMSPAVMGMLGNRPEHYLGRTIFEFVQADDVEHVRAELESLCQNRSAILQVELRLMHADGSLRWLEATCTNLLGDPAVGAIVGNFRDISERRRVEAALRRSEDQLRQGQKMEAIGNLAGGVAHDFNNLLSVILSYSKMLAEDMTPSDPRRADLLEIEAAGQHGVELTRQLLAFGRQQFLQPKVVNLNDIVVALERMLRRLIGESIELNVLPASGLGCVKVDPGQIEQVVMNLAVNSRDAMPNGGKLTIETENVELDQRYADEHVGASAGPHVMLAVTDTGTGIEPSIQGRMFEPFFTTKERGKGTGFGLATVFGIVQQSGGNLWVYSEPGNGTTFKVYFPRTDAVAVRESSRPSALPQGTLRGNETVLLVEDDERVRTLARSILRRFGYHVLEANSGGDALLICEQHTAKIHLMLTDVVMPRMSGRQLAERLQTLRPKMKILFMSGYTDNTIVHHGVLDTGLQFLEKPITPEALARKVRDVLDDVESSIGQVPATA